MQSLFFGLAYFFFEVICYWIGRTFIAVLTFGRIRCERYDNKEDFGWFGRKTSHGSYVMPLWMTVLVGLATLSVAFILGMIALTPRYQGLNAKAEKLVLCPRNITASLATDTI